MSSRVAIVRLLRCTNARPRVSAQRPPRAVEAGRDQHHSDHGKMGPATHFLRSEDGASRTWNRGCGGLALLRASGRRGMKRIAAGLALAALTVAAAAGAAPRPVSKQPAIAFLPLPAPSPTLSRFGSEGEFRSYLRSVRRVVRARNLWWAADSRPVQLAQATPAANTATDAPPPPVCPPEVKDCRSLADERIVVTGSRIPPHNASITNNQTIGVDEGDIVKQAGRFLLILQDGRLFAVDTKPAGAAGLAVTDRMNVYRDPREDTWYDEMLVYGDRVVITGYSYEARASEVSVIRIGADGRF